MHLPEIRYTPPENALLSQRRSDLRSPAWLSHIE
jgi:hypothetical protein